MNIGLDIDNVITAFDNDILKEFLLEDKNKRNAGIINKKARHINHGMFDWSQDEIDELYKQTSEFIYLGKDKDETTDLWGNKCK